MFTTFTALALAGGALRFVLQWQLRKRWDISLAVPQVLAGPLWCWLACRASYSPSPFQSH